MKRFIISLLLTPSLFFGQTQEELDLCMAIQSSGFISNSEAESALEKILNTIGASKNFVLTPCDKINNAIATAYKGTRYILYDKAFMDLISENTNDWSNLFILAHEVGHHINGHLLDILLYMEGDIDSPTLEKKRQQELEADEFAAFVLAKLGANLSDLKSVIEIVSDDKNDMNSSHPNTEKRLASVEKGYKKGFIEKDNSSISIDEFVKLKSNLKFGKWYREQKKDVINGLEWSSQSVGKPVGNLKLFPEGLVLGTEGGYGLKTDMLIHFKYHKKELIQIFESIRNNLNKMDTYKSYLFPSSRNDRRFNEESIYFKRNLLEEIELNFRFIFGENENRFENNINVSFLYNSYEKDVKIYFNRIDLRGEALKKIISRESIFVQVTDIKYSFMRNRYVDFWGFYPKSGLGSWCEYEDQQISPYYPFINEIVERNKSENFYRLVYNASKNISFCTGKGLNRERFKFYVSRVKRHEVFGILEQIKRDIRNFENEINEHLEKEFISNESYFEYDMRGSEKAFSNDFIEQSLFDVIKNKYYEYFE